MILQTAALGRSKFACCAAGQRLQFERSHARAQQMQHGITELLQRPANLPLAPLAQCQCKSGAVHLCIEAAQADFAGRHRSIVQQRACGQTPRYCGAEAPAHCHPVFLLRAERGVQQRLGGIAVVGEQQQALAVLVEAAHGIQPCAARARGQQVEDNAQTGALAAGIAGGGEHAARFVQQPVAERLG